MADIQFLTKEKMEEILLLHQEEALPVFSEERKKEVLKSEALKAYVDSIDVLASQLLQEKTECIPFSIFKLFEVNGDRSNFERCYFERRRKLVCYTEEVMLYGKEEYKEALNDIIWAICDEYAWALPAHFFEKGLLELEYKDHFMVDLFAAETACALAESIYFCKEAVHPIVQERAMRLLTDRVLISFMNKEYHWEKVHNNWAAVCGGNIGMAAIYAEKAGYITIEELGKILWKLQGALENFLEGFPKEGTCEEGIGYWGYGFSYYVDYADLLKVRTGNEIDYFQAPHVQAIAEYHQKMFFSSGCTVSFSDSGSTGTYMYGLLSYLSNQFPSVDIPPIRFAQKCCDDSCGRFANELRNLLWGNLEEKPQKELERIYVMPSSGWYIATSQDGCINMAAKAGHNDEPHNHNDVGSFQIFKGGKQIFADLGAGIYTKDYFKNEYRYEVLCCSSAGHSVPIINGKNQHFGRDFRATDVLVDQKGISMNMANAYEEENLLAFYRKITFSQESGKVQLEESFEWKETGEIVERFISFAKPKVEKGQALFFSKDGSESLKITYDETLFVPSIQKLQYLPHEDSYTDVYCLDLTYNKKQKKDSYTFWIS